MAFPDDKPFDFPAVMNPDIQDADPGLQAAYPDLPFLEFVTSPFSLLKDSFFIKSGSRWALIDSLIHSFIHSCFSPREECDLERKVT